MTIVVSIKSYILTPKTAMAIKAKMNLDFTMMIRVLKGSEHFEVLNVKSYTLYVVASVCFHHQEIFFNTPIKTLHKTEGWDGSLDKSVKRE